MQRTQLNLIIDLSAAALFLAMIATGYLLHFPLPPGTNRALSLWGLTRHQWGEIHFWISLGLLAVLAAHLVLHWNWLVTVIRQRLHLARNEQRHAGWITGSALVGVFAAFALAAHFGVQERAEPCCDDTEPTKPAREEETSLAKTPEQPTKQPRPVFWKDAYPILERSCLSCHGPKKARGNFRVDRKEDFFAMRVDGAWVIPGDVERSQLIPIVTGVRKGIAFPDRHKLSADDAAILKSWIAAGAEFGP